MPSKTWGTEQLIKEYIVVGENDEIPSGQKAYVFNKQVGESEVDPDTWDAFTDGDLTELKNAIERDIPNSKVIWIKISWDHAIYEGMPSTGFWYRVGGFYVEAIVENLGGAGLTGWEIAAIIVAIAFLAAVLIPLALGAWIVWQIITSIPDIAKPFVGIALLIGIALFILILFGARLGLSKKGMTLGR